MMVSLILVLAFINKTVSFTNFKNYCQNVRRILLYLNYNLFALTHYAQHTVSQLGIDLKERETVCEIGLKVKLLFR